MVSLSPSATVSTTSPTSALNNINLLQPTAFKIIIDRRFYSNLEFFCQSVQLPDLSSTPAEIPFRLISRVPFVADKLEYGVLSANILLDENMNSYIEFYNWMLRSVNEEEVKAANQALSNPPTYADVSVAILSSHNNSTRIIKFKDCIPVNLGSVSLETNVNDLNFITVPVSFRFSTFEF